MNVISPKGEKMENKLIDSLDNVAYMNSINKHNVILLADKKYNLKFKRAGSDDKPKNTNDSKRFSNFKGNTTGTSIAPHLNYRDAIKEKEKDKKYFNKPSLDRQYKTNKENSNILLTTNFTSNKF